MTGPQHYRTAIEILDSIGRQQAAGDKLTLADALAAAQVHATLALAAATAGLDAAEGPGGGSATGRTAEDGNAWFEVLR